MWIGAWISFSLIKSVDRLPYTDQDQNCFNAAASGAAADLGVVSGLRVVGQSALV